MRTLSAILSAIRSTMSASSQNMLAPEVPLAYEQAGSHVHVRVTMPPKEYEKKPTDHLYWASTTSADKAPPPKPLSAEEAAAIQARAVAAANGGSAWNKGGNTWEEKKINTWACTLLKDEILPTIAYELPSSALRLPNLPGGVDFDGADAVSVRVTGVDSVSGECTYVLSRGKQRVVFELQMKLLLEAEVKLGGSLQTILTGKLTVPEVSNDDLDEPKMPSTYKCTCDQPPFAKYLAHVAMGAWPGIKASLESLVDQSKVKWC